MLTTQNPKPKTQNFFWPSPNILKLCRLEGVGGQERHDGIDLWIDRFNSVEMSLDDLHSGQYAKA